MNDRLATNTPTESHHRFRKALMGVVTKESADLDAQEILAIVAHFVGQLIAMQDQRVMTVAMATELVARNIEQGNLEAVGKIKSADEGKPQ